MRPFIEAEWPGRFVIPDLRGHGRSPHAEPYGFGTLSADVADLLPQGCEVAILGHSMAGPSAWFWPAASSACASAASSRSASRSNGARRDSAGARKLAATPARRFETRDQAVERYLKVSGLAGLVDPDSPTAAAGVVEEDGAFRLAADPRAAAVAGPPIADLIAGARAPLRLAAGEQDAMSPLAVMGRFDHEAAQLPALGHNAHVEAPEAVWRAFAQFAAASGTTLQGSGAKPRTSGSSPASGGGGPCEAWWRGRQAGPRPLHRLRRSPSPAAPRGGGTRKWPISRQRQFSRTTPVVTVSICRA